MQMAADVEAQQRAKEAALIPPGKAGRKAVVGGGHNVEVFRRGLGRLGCGMSPGAGSQMSQGAAAGKGGGAHTPG